MSEHSQVSFCVVKRNSHSSAFIELIIRLIFSRQVSKHLSHVAQIPRFIVNVAGISWRRQINWSQSINNNLSHAVIRLVSCTAVAIVHHWQFYLDKIATDGAQAKSGSALCASGAAIRIQWGNLRSIYHTWESHRLPATCIRKPCTWTSHSSFCIWPKSHCQFINFSFATTIME